MPTADNAHSRQIDETDRSPIADLSIKQPLRSLDLDTPQKAATEGRRLVDELDQIEDRYSTAMGMWEEDDDYDLDYAFEIAGIDGDSRVNKLTRWRIRWVHEALREWIRYVIKNGMATHDEVRAVYEEINLNTPGTDE